jgi:hypothetical protein
MSLPRTFKIRGQSLSIQSPQSARNAKTDILKEENNENHIHLQANHFIHLPYFTKNALECSDLWSEMKSAKAPLLKVL